jgi:hypothetical protein
MSRKRTARVYPSERSPNLLRERFEHQVLTGLKEGSHGRQHIFYLGGGMEEGRRHHIRRPFRRRRRHAALAATTSIAAALVLLAASIHEPAPVATGVARAAVCPTYPALINQHGARAYWRLGDAGATAADASGHGYTGSYQGGRVLGRIGALLDDVDGASQLDGITGRVNIPISAVPSGAPLTLEGWARGVASTDRGALISSTASGTSFAGAQLYVESNGATERFVSFRLAPADGTNYYLWGSGSVKDDAWHHYVGTYDGSTMRLYMDGQLVNAGPGPSSVAAGTAARIGQDTVFPSFFFKGLVDEVATYARALSQQEIGDHFDLARGVCGVSINVPRIVTAPVASDDTTAFGTVKTTSGTWDGPEPITFAYQWQRCLPNLACAAIAGATNAVYQIVDDDLGATLVAQVTATNGRGARTVASNSISIPNPTTPVQTDLIIEAPLPDPGIPALTLAEESTAQQIVQQDAFIQAVLAGGTYTVAEIGVWHADTGTTLPKIGASLVLTLSSPVSADRLWPITVASTAPPYYTQSTIRLLAENASTLDVVVDLATQRVVEVLPGEEAVITPPVGEVPDVDSAGY